MGAGLRSGETRLDLNWTKLELTKTHTSNLAGLLWQRLHWLRLDLVVSAEPPPLSTVSVVEAEKGVSVETLWRQLPVLSAGSGGLRCSASVDLSLTGEKQAAALWLASPSLFQERFQVKSPPSTYLTKIRGFYQDQGGVTRRVSTLPKTNQVQTSTSCLLLLFFYIQIKYLSLSLLLQLKKRVQDATQVLKDLEISLRTNHIG